MVTLEQLPADSRPGRPWQPGYTVYGGAHLFGPDTPDKLLALARRWLKDYPWLPETARKRVEARLSQPLEDLRIDFEDGYGRRSDEEEDSHAQAVARALPQAQSYRRIGLRLKPITRGWAARALRTLHLATAELSVWPRGFCVTLPKVEDPLQVRWFLEQSAELEAGRGPFPLELMVESPLGLERIRAAVAAAGERCRGVHFGPWDFLASCEVTQGELHHPINHQARTELLWKLRGAGLELADGPTTRLPLPLHRQPLPAQIPDNHKAVRAAWERHRDDVLESRSRGYRQSWLLHPAQLVSHTAALLQEHEQLLPAALRRLADYWRDRGQARASGGDFDDRATARVWVETVSASLALGLLQEEEIAAELPPGWREI